MLVCVRREANQEAQAANECTDSYSLPATDGIVAAALGGVGIAIVSHSGNGSTGEGLAKIYFGVPSLVLGAIYGLSAWYGANVVSECRAAEAAATATPVGDVNRSNE